MARSFKSATIPDESAALYYWRRTDVEGLERLALTVEETIVRAISTVICVAEGGFRLDHDWELTPDWRAVSLKVERLGAHEHRALTLERDGTAWRVNGVRRPDLDGADEPDLSVTPFSNTLPIRRLLASADVSVTIDVAYVNGGDLTVTRSRQRYERQGPGRLRYIDLGLFAGFEADLYIDDQGLVLDYQHLFQRVEINVARTS
jgi:hypothetical protein